MPETVSIMIGPKKLTIMATANFFPAVEPVSRMASLCQNIAILNNIDPILGPGGNFKRAVKVNPRIIFLEKCSRDRL